jgi:hypothetical protein
VTHSITLRTRSGVAKSDPIAVELPQYIKRTTTGRANIYITRDDAGQYYETRPVGGTWRKARRQDIARALYDKAISRYRPQPA